MDKLVKITSADSQLNHSNLLTLPPPATKQFNRGYNILHFNTSNRPYENNPSAAAFVKTTLLPHLAKELNSDSEVLTEAVAMAKKLNPDSQEVFLEFGFCTGRSLNFISALAFDKNVYGFDSCKGLPVFWRDGFDAGTFAYKDENVQPFCPLDNTTLIVGLIEETLPLFIKECEEDGIKSIDFIHVDTDIYETASFIFERLKNYIVPGKTVIVLDEGYNYYAKEDTEQHNEWQKHEWRAANEFADESGYRIKYFAYNKNHQQLAFTFNRIS